MFALCCAPILLWACGHCSSHCLVDVDFVHKFGDELGHGHDMSWMWHVFHSWIEGLLFSLFNPYGTLDRSEHPAVSLMLAYLCAEVDQALMLLFRDRLTLHGEDAPGALHQGPPATGGTWLGAKL